jgi:hypothetical protein
LAGSSVTDTINFSYSDQNNFNQAGANNTDFDCEAFIVSADSIFLFTKQWLSNKTSVYSLAKTPGRHTARLKFTLNVQGLITGAVYLESKRLIVLCGYSGLLEPFLYLLYDFTGSDYFNGNKRKILISLPFHQVEGIATGNGLKYYVSNESFVQLPYISVPQKLHILDLKIWLENYLKTIALNLTETEIKNDIIIYPVPTENFITVHTEEIFIPSKFILMNCLGQVISSGKLTNNNQRVDMSDLQDGLYILKIGKSTQHTYKIIKR